MQIDHDSPVPLHYQVEKLLRELIRQPQYQEGKLLPPEEQIAAKLSVSRSTLRGAISRLVQEGLLERKAGRGTRIIKQPVKTELSNWPSFTGEMRRRGIEVENFSLSASLVSASEKVRRKLILSESKEAAEVVKMERVRGAEGVPWVYSISWFHPRANLTPSEDFTKPLYEIIKDRSGLTPAFSREEITAVLADEELADLLCCQVGDALLLRQRLVETEGKQQIEFNINYYVAEHFSYSLTLQKL